MMSAEDVLREASAFETREYTIATTFLGYLRNIGRQLDNIEKQAAEGNEAARVGGSSAGPVVGGVLRPGITPHQQPPSNYSFSPGCQWLHSNST